MQAVNDIPSPSIATKNSISSKDSKKNSKVDFASFMQNLGKTIPNKSNNKEVNLNKNIKNTTNIKNTNIKQDLALSDILATKALNSTNNISKEDKTSIDYIKNPDIKNPIDELLKNPTKNPMQNIKEIKENDIQRTNYGLDSSNTIKKVDFKKKEESLENKSIKALPPKEVNLNNIVNSSNILDSLDSPNEQKPKNQIKNNTQDRDESKEIHLSQISQPNKAKDDVIKDDIKSNFLKNNVLESKPSEIKPNTQDRDNNIKQDDDSKDSKESLIDNSSDLGNSNIINKDNANKSDDKNNTNIGIKNTLKYGAFSAFDAISLLKPSDGKKLSDLIKKADELSLNLEKIKYQKIEKPNTINIDNKDSKIPTNTQLQPSLPIIESKDTKIDNLLNDNQKGVLQEPLKEVLKENQNTKGTQKEILKETPKDSQKDFKDSSQKEPSKELPKENPKDITKESKSNIQDYLSKQSIESKDPKPIKEEVIKENTDIKPVSLKQEYKKQVDEPKNTKNESNNIPINQTNLAEFNNIKNDQNRIFDAKETIRSFVGNLKQEIMNSKPPISKITLELTPANLGSVEVSIIHQGKNIQVQLNSNQNTLNLFIQNQSDLRAALNQIGYENITMSFSNGSQMGFSDGNGKWNYYSNNDKMNNFRNENSLESENANNFEITIINNYA
ncbi:flagellar hook-length control protein FliK [Helicobacter sp. MIT 14-3879]|uniref:flagellar hook-length control protein FliK n=1 Tax=Helicobacter sp. MIT 14-3879 TaxID=2040649 RepID=UPI000E1E7F0C|nr:flagellar hook-length control protein FliK [Helicobacter sp. MIT 14-3879]RDU65598.1 hypothetical protein CQA44_01060 [Helicobacter sp. MIT 14-3879]